MSTRTEDADPPGQLVAEHRMVDGICVVALSGEIDLDVKSVLSEALHAGHDAGPPRIVADLSEVTFMDSSGISVFICAHQDVSGQGGWLRIACAQKPVLRVLEMVGADAVIPSHPTVQQALAD
ncbi:STAS domain-containing protein [Streptomyces uncialis]|uniref:STAS domain-containing protein n=1 Tax=Streptomyces uncialis TaxID=1048205 RepID=UPI0037FFD33C